ncbi:MAG: hypothetical protein JNK11_19950 [Alphaproteobacteria bacterium]|nr:hypothetical protein [Alphaproteobacteria bacterium]
MALHDEKIGRYLGTRKAELGPSVIRGGKVRLTADQMAFLDEPGGLRALGKRGIFRYRTHEEADSAAIEDMARARRPLFRAKR